MCHDFEAKCAVTHMGHHILGITSTTNLKLARSRNVLIGLGKFT